jgi:hypothetical protein
MQVNPRASSSKPSPLVNQQMKPTAPDDSQRGAKLGKAGYRRDKDKADKS